MIECRLELLTHDGVLIEDTAGGADNIIIAGMSLVIEYFGSGAKLALSRFKIEQHTRIAALPATEQVISSIRSVNSTSSN